MNSDVPIGQLFSQLVDDGKRYARAEVELYKAKAVDKAQPLKMAAVFAGIAVTLALSAVTALLVGLILALETLVGPLAATLIVVLVAFVIAGGLGYFAYRKVLEAKR
jgi:lysozyme family protein